MRDQLTVRKGEDYLQLEYQHDDKFGEIVLPSSTLTLQLKVFINNNQLRPTNYGGLLQLLINKLKLNSYWEQALDYEVSYDMNETHQSSFDIELKCNIFHNLQQSDENLLRNIQITIHCLTNQEVWNILDMTTSFNYLLSSWLIHIEYHLPLVFSSYGRQYIKLNMAWYRKYYYIVFDMLASNDKIISMLQLLQCHVRENLLTIKLLHGPKKDCEMMVGLFHLFGES